MGVFGLTKAGRDIQGQLHEIPRWMFDLFKTQAGRGNELFDQGSYFRDLFGQGLQDRFNAGFGTPEEVARTGREVLPGVEDAISRRGGRLSRIQDLLREVPGGAHTTGDISGILDELGGAISRTSDVTDRNVNDAFRRIADVGRTTQGDVVRNIQDTFGGAQEALGNTTGDILRDVSGTFGGLTDELGETFGSARENLELIRPGGEAAAARSARSFAPVIRQTMERLRRSSIDPNSPEAASLLRQVGTARSRAMDDQFADAAQSFADRSNELLLGEQAGRERLGLGRLGASTDISRGALDTDIGLRLGAGETFRDALRTDQDFRTAVETGRLGEILRNRNQTFDRTRDFLGQRANIPLLNRSLGLEDFQIQGDLLREMNQEDLNALNLRDFQRQRGAEHIGRNLDVRGGALSDMGNLMNTLLNASQGFTGQGLTAANLAQGGFESAFGKEAAQSGKIGRVLGGLAGTALGMFNPVGRVFGGSTNTGGQTFNPFGARTPPFNPNARFLDPNFNPFRPPSGGGR